jgi:hypothetical protein
MHGCVIAGTEALTIVLNRRRRNRRVPEVGMMIDAGRASGRNITLRCRKTIVEAALADLVKLGRGWRHCISDRSRM